MKPKTIDEIKTKIKMLKAWSGFWKRDLDREILLLKFYLSDEWIDKFGEEDALESANRAHGSFSEMKRVNAEIEDLEELLKTMGS